MSFSTSIIQKSWQKVEIVPFPGADSSADDDGRLLEGSQLSLQNVQGIRGFTGGVRMVAKIRFPLIARPQKQTWMVLSIAGKVAG